MPLKTKNRPTRKKSVGKSRRAKSSVRAGEVPIVLSPYYFAGKGKIDPGQMREVMTRVWRERQKRLAAIGKAE
jgi:hypothetical protein